MFNINNIFIFSENVRSKNLNRVSHFTVFHSGRYSCTAPLSVKRQSAKAFFRFKFCERVNGYRDEEIMLYSSMFGSSGVKHCFS